MSLLGIDLGASKTLGVVIDDGGMVLGAARRPTERGPQGVLRSAVGVIEELRDGPGSQASRVGIGMPGLVDHRSGCIKHAVNLGLGSEWWAFAQMLSEAVELPVQLDNDANAAALGAAAVLGVDDLALLSIGSGLAAGLVLDGRVRRGFRLAAGEIGHIPIAADGGACQCGQRGCLEAIASGSALAAAWPTVGHHPAQALFAAADAGDRAAIQTRHRFVSAIASSIQMIGLTVDTRAIVLGGGVAALGEPLRSAVADALERQAAASTFLAALELSSRVVVLPSDTPVAALGAAMLHR